MSGDFVRQGAIEIVIRPVRIVLIVEINQALIICMHTAETTPSSATRLAADGPMLSVRKDSTGSPRSPGIATMNPPTGSADRSHRYGSSLSRAVAGCAANVRFWRLRREPSPS